MLVSFFFRFCTLDIHIFAPKSSTLPLQSCNYLDKSQTLILISPNTIISAHVILILQRPRIWFLRILSVPHGAQPWCLLKYLFLVEGQKLRQVTGGKISQFSGVFLFLFIRSSAFFSLFFYRRSLQQTKRCLFRNSDNFFCITSCLGISPGGDPMTSGFYPTFILLFLSPSLLLLRQNHLSVLFFFFFLPRFLNYDFMLVLISLFPSLAHT